MRGRVAADQEVCETSEKDKGRDEAQISKGLKALQELCFYLERE